MKTKPTSMAKDARGGMKEWPPATKPRNSIFIAEVFAQATQFINKRRSMANARRHTISGPHVLPHLSLCLGKANGRCRVMALGKAGPAAKEPPVGPLGDAEVHKEPHAPAVTNTNESIQLVTGNTINSGKAAASFIAEPIMI